jgi:hypothetical protein
VELLAVGVAEHSPVDKIELEQRIGQLVQEFASLQYVELAEVSVVAPAGPGIGCKVRLVAGVQGRLSWLRRLFYYRIADTVLEELRTQHRSIVADHKPPVDFCQCRSSQHY